MASGGDGGGDQDSIASGKLGNGGSVSIAQAGVAGAITLLAQRASPSGTSISILSKATQASGEALVEIGHSALVASAQAGSAVPYLPVDTAVSLFGVREGNGGSIGISQGGVNGDILFDARDALKVDATTVLASGRATILTGHQQIVADNVYGARNGAVTAGAGAGSISVEDIDVATGATGFTDTVHASPVQDADGGNVVISQADIAAGIILQSRNGNVDVLADGNTGETTTYVGHQRFTRATTGEGGTSGIAGERAPARRRNGPAHTRDRRGRHPHPGDGGEHDRHGEDDVGSRFDCGRQGRADGRLQHHDGPLRLRRRRLQCSRNGTRRVSGAFHADFGRRNEQSGNIA